MNKETRKIFYTALTLICVFFFMNGVLEAETVSGNGYTVEQVITPLEGSISGNGYVLEQSAQPLGGKTSGGGYSLFSVFGISSPATTTSTTTPPPSVSYVSRGSGYYVFPQPFIGALPSTSTPSSTGTVYVPQPPHTQIPVSGNGSTCSSRIVFSGPIDIDSPHNNQDDVKKLEQFLNMYEKENLVVNGIYEKKDIEAVKRWQRKYRSFILDPMRLKNPTGTVYSLSQRQIERQSTKPCGEPVIVTACPFFKTNVSYGDKNKEVKKVQQFLNIVQGEKLPLSGVFGPLTRDAVKRFQKSRKIYVATFIPISFATGNWYTTTRVKANETIGCDILR